MKAIVGDWVRFYNCGVPVTGVVEYARYKSALQTEEYLTDVGSVGEDEVLEVRRKQ